MTNEVKKIGKKLQVQIPGCRSNILPKDQRKSKSKEFNQKTLVRNLKLKAPECKMEWLACRVILVCSLVISKYVMRP